MTSNLDLIRGRQVVQPLTNQSGGAIIAGDVVIVSTANDESFTTTTSAAYNSTRVGVALDSIAAAASGRILLEGYAPLVNVSASATRGHYLLTHTVAKQATSQAGYAAGAFGQIVKAGTTPSAVIFPVAQVGSAGVTRSGSTTGDHLAVWNGSNADSIKDGGAVSSGGLTQISKVSVGVGGAASIAFNSIAGTYSALRLLAQLRGTAAATEVDLNINFNADSGANYNQYLFIAYNNTFTQAASVTETRAYMGGMSGGNAPAGTAEQLSLDLVNYAGTTFHKNFSFTNSYKVGTATGDMRTIYGQGNWRNTAAITDIVLTLSSGNFAEGSVAILYGLA